MSKNVCVVRGGVSHESGKSVLYGAKILDCLRQLGHNVSDLYLHPNGTFTLDGENVEIENLLQNFDYIYNCLVGEDGERGLVELLADKNKVKLAGHSHIVTTITADKNNFLKLAKSHKMKTPFSVLLKSSEDVKNRTFNAFSTVGIPAIVKPKSSSGLKNVDTVNNFTEMYNAVEKIFKDGDDAVVEKLIKGVPVSVFVLPHGNLLHTNIHVYGENNLTKDQLINIRNEAVYLHEVLALDHHLEIDYIFSPRGLYVIEANTHPSLVHGHIGDFFRDNVVSLKNYIADKII